MIVLIIFYLPYKSEHIRPANILKYSSTRESHASFLMITENEKWHYLVVISKTTSKHDREVHCLNFFHSFRTENKLKDHENVCKNCDYCYIEMLKKESILKYNHGKKSTTASGYSLFTHCSSDATNKQARLLKK